MQLMERVLYAAVVVTGLAMLCGCGDAASRGVYSSTNGTSSSSGTTATTIVTANYTRADVDAAAFLKVHYEISGDQNYKGLDISLSGPGKISTTGPDVFFGYDVTYTPPNGYAGSVTTITATSRATGSTSVSTVITLHDAINFPAQTPPDAMAGTPYSYAFTGASGGTGTLRYTLYSAGTTLPPGLALNAAGVLSGTPTMVGTYKFQVNLVDQATQVIGVIRDITVQVS